MALLSESERDSALAGLPGWSFDADRNGISSTFRFADFGTAFGFMTQVALAAERADHHPDWCNMWDRVDILLSTHREGGVTARDIALARGITAIAASFPGEACPAEPSPATVRGADRES